MDSSEQHRHECECRHWLRRGYTTRAKVDDLHARIAAKRGKAAADRLIQGMRDELRKSR